VCECVCVCVKTGLTTYTNLQAFTASIFQFVVLCVTIIYGYEEWYQKSVGTRCLLSVKRKVEQKVKKTVGPIQESIFQSPTKEKCSTYGAVGWAKWNSRLNFLAILWLSSVLPRKYIEEERICSKIHDFFGN